jgi:isocitrate dehydrogenase
VTNNLYGDIISDIAAQVAGSVGLCGSANIGERYAMFEAIHGTAPDIAGTGIANPSGLISASILMLAHMGESLSATLLADAWTKTLAAGFITTDLSHFRNLFENPQILTTQEFANEVEGRIEAGTASTSTLVMPLPCPRIKVAAEKDRNMRLVGVDVTVTAIGKEDPADRIKRAYLLSGIPLSRLTDCPSDPSTFTIRCESPNLSTVTGLEVCEMIRCLVLAGFDVTATQNLYASASGRCYFE